MRNRKREAPTSNTFGDLYQFIMSDLRSDNAEPLGPLDGLRDVQCLSHKRAHIPHLVALQFSTSIQNFNGLSVAMPFNELAK